MAKLSDSGTPAKIGPGARRVLVVDDDPEARATARATLETQGWRVLEAESGEGFLRTMAENKVDLVLLDIVMPGMDGLTACKALRKNAALDYDVPVIVLTAKGERETIVRAINAGANDYIVKPFAPDVLVEKVRKLLP